jgi:hypothetical protein
MSDASDSNDGVQQSDQPIDRLTGLCAQMTPILNQPENADVRAIVFLNDASHGGIQMHGYEDSATAMAELFVHMRAIFRSMGKELEFVAVPESPQGLDGT